MRSEVAGNTLSMAPFGVWAGPEVLLSRLR